MVRFSQCHFKGGHSYCIWKDIIISLLSLFWDESGSFSLKFVSSLSRISTKCESIPAYKTYLHVTGIIVLFSELSRCFWKLNWVDSRSPSCFWLIELCERNKNLYPPLIFLLIENTLRIVHLLIPANWVDIGSTSQFLLIKLINRSTPHSLLDLYRCFEWWTDWLGLECAASEAAVYSIYSTHSVHQTAFCLYAANSHIIMLIESIYINRIHSGFSLYMGTWVNGSCAEEDWNTEDLAGLFLQSCSTCVTHPLCKEVFREPGSRPLNIV